MQKKKKKEKKNDLKLMSKEFHFAIKNKNKGFHTEYRSFEQDK